MFGRAGKPPVCASAGEVALGLQHVLLNQVRSEEVHQGDEGHPDHRCARDAEEVRLIQVLREVRDGLPETAGERQHGTDDKCQYGGDHQYGCGPCLDERQLVGTDDVDGPHLHPVLLYHPYGLEQRFHVGAAEVLPVEDEVLDASVRPFSEQHGALGVHDRDGHASEHHEDHEDPRHDVGDGAHGSH